jgi:glycosyltransferase involved in cell wall biosynthesis
MSQRSKSLLGACLMLKNEKKRLRATLDSLVVEGKPVVDCLVVLDTGSTDNTIQIAQDFCDEYKLNFHLKTTKWIDDFGFTRNEMLEFIDSFDKENPLCKYSLLLDCNDELKNGKELYKLLDNIESRIEMKKKKKEKRDKKGLKEKKKEEYPIGYKVCQNWWNGINTDQYYNVRLIKNRTGWRYKEPIHEYIYNDCMKTASNLIGQLSDTIVLFQDRTLDDDKSMKRFSRDRTVFHREFLKEATPRRVFYYGQTLKCLSQFGLSYRLYKMRLSMEDYCEEVYESYLSCGQLSRLLGHDWDESLNFLMKACQVNGVGKRCEPLLEIVKYYIDNNNFNLAYKFCKEACELAYPFHCSLFVKKYCYDFERYSVIVKIINELDKRGEKGERKEELLKYLEICIDFMEKNSKIMKNESLLSEYKRQKKELSK